MPKPDPPESPQPSLPFSPQEAMAFFQRMWNPLGVPMPGFATPATAAAAGSAAPETPFINPALMFPALDPAEIDRKITELRVIESWLSMSLNMMQMSIKTMELQKSSLEAFAAAQTPSGARGKSGKGAP